MSEDNNASVPNEPEREFFAGGLTASAMLLDKATKAVWYGLGLWTAAAIVTAYTLGSTSPTGFYWWGGGIVGMIGWYRAFNWFRAAKALAAKDQTPLVLNPVKHYLPAGLAVVVAATSLFILVPEYNHVNSPGVGTCYVFTSKTNVVPVACFSPNATMKATRLVSNPDFCPTNYYFEPDSTEKDYTCLGKVN